MSVKAIPVKNYLRGLDILELVDFSARALQAKNIGAGSLLVAAPAHIITLSTGTLLVVQQLHAAWA